MDMDLTIQRCRPWVERKQHPERMQSGRLLPSRSYSGSVLKCFVGCHWQSSSKQIVGCYTALMVCAWDTHTLRHTLPCETQVTVILGRWTNYRQSEAYIRRQSRGEKGGITWPDVLCLLSWACLLKGSVAEPADLKCHTNTFLGLNSPLHSELAEWASHFNCIARSAMGSSQQKSLPIIAF